MADDESKPERIGCRFPALLFISILVLIDVFGTLASVVEAAGYVELLRTLCWICSGCGAGVGAYFSMRTKPRTEWSPWYWLVGGLLGATLAFCITFVSVARSVH